ncbi:MAG: hypothetical protein ACLSAP_00905 [Oscillospiraceae bacterium]
MQYMYQPQGYNPAIAETQNGYYFMVGFICFMQIKIPCPLFPFATSQIVCIMKNQSGKVMNCNACIICGISPDQNFVAYYKDFLYVLSGYNPSTQSTIPELVQLSPDGSQHKQNLFSRRMFFPWPSIEAICITLKKATWTSLIP